MFQKALTALVKAHQRTWGEGNIFTGVCHSVQGVGMPGPKSLSGVGGGMPVPETF